MRCLEPFVNSMLSFPSIYPRKWLRGTTTTLDLTDGAGIRCMRICSLCDKGTSLVLCVMRTQRTSRFSQRLWTTTLIILHRNNAIMLSPVITRYEKAPSTSSSTDNIMPIFRRQYIITCLGNVYYFSILSFLSPVKKIPSL